MGENGLLVGKNGFNLRCIKIVLKAIVLHRWMPKSGGDFLVLHPVKEIEKSPHLPQLLKLTIDLKIFRLYYEELLRFCVKANEVCIKIPILLTYANNQLHAYAN